jgi:hypothetical protein
MIPSLARGSALHTSNPSPDPIPRDFTPRQLLPLSHHYVSPYLFNSVAAEGEKSSKNKVVRADAAKRLRFKLK